MGEESLGGGVRGGHAELQAGHPALRPAWLCTRVGSCPPVRPALLCLFFSIGQIHTEKKKKPGGFPGSPVVKTSRFQCRGTGSISDHRSGSWIRHATWCGQKSKEICVASADVNAMYKRLSPCLHTHVHGGQKGGTIQCPPVGEWVEKWWSVVSYSAQKGKKR